MKNQETNNKSRIFGTVGMAPEIKVTQTGNVLSVTI